MRIATRASRSPAPSALPKARAARRSPARSSWRRSPRAGRRAGVMRRFAALYDAIDRTTSTNAKVAALVEYFRSAPPADAAWAVYFLTGRRLKRLLPSASLREWVRLATGLPEWLIA